MATATEPPIAIVGSRGPSPVSSAEACGRFVLGSLHEWALPHAHTPTRSPLTRSAAEGPLHP
eukprot:4487329-Pyramimonas_sp.AAC.1